MHERPPVGAVVGQRAPLGSEAEEVLEDVRGSFVELFEARSGLP
jgi:hypothetical protein